MWSVNVDVYISPLLGLTLYNTQLSLLPLDAQNAAFNVDARRIRPTFRCWQSMYKTQLSMLAVHVENLPFVVRNRCLLQCWNLSLFCTLNSQHVYRNIYNMSLYKFHSTFFQFLQIQTLAFNTEVKDGSSRIKFCLTESLPFQRELFTGRNY